MRLTISSAQLNSTLGNLSKVISSKNTMPLLNCFLFEVAGGQLSVTASDNENVMTTRLELSDCDGEGRFCISSRTIADAVKELDEQPVTIEVDPETWQTRIIYLNGMYNIVAQPADEYPATMVMEGESSSFTIPSQRLLENITRSLFATGQDELRPVMNGIFFDLQPDGLRVAATDGHKLVRNTVYDTKSEQPASFILPKKPATLLKNVLLRDESDATVEFNGRVAIITFAASTLTCRLTEGRYPNYNSVIPENNENVVVMDRRTLLGSLRRVLPFASDQSQLVRLRIENSKIEVSAEDIDFSTSAREEAICQYDGTPMSIGFKGTVLTEILNNLDSDNIIIKLADPTRSGIVLPEQQPEGQETLMLMMPMLLND